MDPLKIRLVDTDDLVEVSGLLQVLLQLQLSGVDHPGHEVSVHCGGEVDEPRSEQLQSVLLDSWTQR